MKKIQVTIKGFDGYEVTMIGHVRRAIKAVLGSEINIEIDLVDSDNSSIGINGNINQIARKRIRTALTKVVSPKKIEFS